MSVKNPNCDGERCAGPGEVRVYPIGGGSNLILCRRCFARENDFQRQHWPQREIVRWESAKHYPEDAA
jgi:hypothetical protein